MSAPSPMSEPGQTQHQPLPSWPQPAEPFLPHAAPMALLDDIIDFGESFLQAQVSIEPETAFFADTGVPVWVGIEYMAQCIAAYAGVKAWQHAQPVKIGFLVSTRRMDCAVDEFSNGQMLQIFAQQVSGPQAGLATFDCRIEVNDQIVTKARINVFQPDDPVAFLAQGKTGEATT